MIEVSADRLAMSHVHAWRQRERLQLDALERFDAAGCAASTNDLTQAERSSGPGALRVQGVCRRESLLPLQQLP